MKTQTILITILIVGILSLSFVGAFLFHSYFFPRELKAVNITLTSESQEYVNNLFKQVNPLNEEFLGFVYNQTFVLAGYKSAEINGKVLETVNSTAYTEIFYHNHPNTPLSMCYPSGDDLALESKIICVMCAENQVNCYEK